MGYKFEVTIEAEIDTQEAIDYYSAINGSLAERLLDDLALVFSKVAANPQFYKYIPKKRHGKYRYTKLKTFPYVVVYRVEDTSVVIYRVFNTHRKPWYEQGKMKK